MRRHPGGHYGEDCVTSDYMLGIDTGGTYTDAVIYSETHGIVAKAKSLLEAAGKAGMKITLHAPKLQEIPQLAELVIAIFRIDHQSVIKSKPHVLRSARRREQPAPDQRTPGRHDLSADQDPRFFVAAFKNECVRLAPNPQGGVETFKGNRRTRIGKRPAC